MAQLITAVLPNCIREVVPVNQIGESKSNMQPGMNDNESVVINMTRPESPCKKKHNSAAYHKARESIAAKTIRVAKEPGGTNTADLFTKLMGGEIFRNHLKRCMW